jgi:branched-chain amino acid transport system ATP-binding protein
MLSVENVSAGYGRALAIRGVYIAVERGEIVVLLGANGAGKSTLLKTISGVVKPREGHIAFLGKPIDGQKPHALARMGIIQIQEGRGILGRMNVLENLEMGAYCRKDKTNIQEDLKKVLARFPVLEERLQQTAGTLSGGEQQMLAIGRALMAKPRLLLMDEPSLGLAPMVVESIFRTIGDLRKEEGYSILLVEQNANEALHLGDRGYVMETGRIVLEGSCQELLDNKEVKKAYLG